MSAPVSKELFEAVMIPLREDVRQLVDLQREQNGRVAKLETRLSVLEDRSPGRAASMWGAVAGGAISVLTQMLSTGGRK
jgi:hypothetical protein